MQNVDSIVIKPSVCPLDCPDTCSLQVSVQNNQVIKVRGSKSNPYTAGVICDKVSRFYPDFVHGESRLRQPLIRNGEKGSGEFKTISWSDAIDIIVEKTRSRVEQYGPETVLPLNYAGPHGQISGGSIDRRFFHKLGATLLDRSPLCGAVRGHAYTSLFGNSPGMPPEQAVHADTIAVWGNNVTVSNLHFARVIKQARNKGAKLIIIDPKRTRIAEQADLFIQIAPGTDVVLALALANHLQQRGALDQQFIDHWVKDSQRYLENARSHTLEQAASICDVPMESLNKLADYYLRSKNLALSIGNGIERGKSGGSSLRAIMALNILTGHLGRPGAGIIAKPGFAFPTTPDSLQRPDLIPDGTRTVNIVDVGRHLLEDDLDPPLRSIFIYNHNPVITHPDQNRMMRALSRDELFVTGIDVVMTDSMKFCDIVLPASSHFEFDDLYTAYGQSYLQRAEPVIAPVADSLPNTEIFRRLAKAYGFDGSEFTQTDKQLIDAAINCTDDRLEGVLPSELPTDQALMIKANTNDEVMMCNTVFPDTRSGKIELFSDVLEQKYGFGLPRFEPQIKDKPFTVISPSSKKRINGTFGHHVDNLGMEVVEIHPSDAQQAGIKDGDPVQLENERGQVELKAKVTDAVKPGVLYSPKGTWLACSQTHQSVNALISADIKTDILNGACYNETFVDLRSL